MPRMKRLFIFIIKDKYKVSVFISETFCSFFAGKLKNNISQVQSSLRISNSFPNLLMLCLHFAWENIDLEISERFNFTFYPSQFKNVGCVNKRYIIIPAMVYRVMMNLGFGLQFLYLLCFNEFVFVGLNMNTDINLLFWPMLFYSHFNHSY